MPICKEGDSKERLKLEMFFIPSHLKQRITQPDQSQKTFLGDKLW